MLRIAIRIQIHFGIILGMKAKLQVGEDPQGWGEGWNELFLHEFVTIRVGATRLRIEGGAGLGLVRP